MLAPVQLLSATRQNLWRLTFIRIFKLGDRPSSAQANGGKRAQQRRKAQGQAQLKPRQRQQIEPIGNTYRARLRG